MLTSKWNRLKPYLLLLLLMLVTIIYIYVIFCLFALLNVSKYGTVSTSKRFIAEVFAFEGENIFAALFFPCYSIIASLGFAKIKWLKNRKLLYHLTCWIMSILLIFILSSFGGGISTWEDMTRILVFSLYSFWISWGASQRVT